MALVGLGGKEELKGHVGRGRGVVEESMRLVVGGDLGAQPSCQGLLLLVLVVLLCDGSCVCYLGDLPWGRGRGVSWDNGICRWRLEQVTGQRLGRRRCDVWRRVVVGSGICRQQTACGQKRISRQGSGACTIGLSW